MESPGNGQKGRGTDRSISPQRTPIFGRDPIGMQAGDASRPSRAGRDTEIRGGVKDAQRTAAKQLNTNPQGHLLLS